MQRTLHAHNDRVFIVPDDKPGETLTKGGILLPETSQKKPQMGTVLAVGPGRRDETGKRHPIDLRKGDRVLFAKYGGTDIEVEGETIHVVREDDILARITTAQDQGT